MGRREILARFGGLRVWRGNGRRAPHKPLLILWALGRCLAGAERLAPFSVVDQELGRLLLAFGPHRQATRTEFPFWRLCNDGVWELDRPNVVTTTSSHDAHRSSLLTGNVHGGLLEDDYNAFRENPLLARQVADWLIDAHFPETYREDILTATRIGASRLSLAEQELEVRENREQYELTRRRRREPGFREAVLRAYGDQCAVCGLNIRLAELSIAVEAAHIHWLKDAGPSNVPNGLALCVMHHRLFDRGAFTVEEGYRVLVAANVEGPGSRGALGRFAGNRLRILPEQDSQRPDVRHLIWHAKEVFRPLAQTHRTVPAAAAGP